MSTSAADLDVVRDYWNRRPCNIRHSQAESGSKEYFDQVEARSMVEPQIRPSPISPAGKESGLEIDADSERTPRTSLAFKATTQALNYRTLP
jgi:hypothetical protein